MTTKRWYNPDYRDRAEYMRQYREDGGSTRDYTRVRCFCGEYVARYNLTRHQNGVRHPSPVTGQSVTEAESERAQAEIDQSRRERTLRDLNSRLFIQAGESASPSQLENLSFALTKLDHNENEDPGWDMWVFSRCHLRAPYWGYGEGREQYLQHLALMREDQQYERNVQRARRRFHQHEKRRARAEAARKRAGNDGAGPSLVERLPTHSTQSTITNDSEVRSAKTRATQSTSYPKDLRSGGVYSEQKRES